MEGTQIALEQKVIADVQGLVVQSSNSLKKSLAKNLSLAVLTKINLGNAFC